MATTEAAPETEGSIPLPGISRPPFARTKGQLEELGKWLHDLVTMGQSSKGGLTNIWSEIGRNYRDEMPDDDETQGQGQAITHVGIMSPRILTLARSLNTVLLDQEPYMLCKGVFDPDLSDAMERVLHREWQAGGLERMTRIGTLESNITNRFMYRVSFDLIPQGLLPENSDHLTLQPFNPEEPGMPAFSGLRIDGIRAIDFIIGPETVDGVQSAAVVGHRFFQSVGQIKELQELGRYISPPDFAMEMLGGDSPATVTNADATAYYHAMVAPAAFTGKETDLAECYEVYVRKSPEEGKRMKWYRMVIAYNAPVILEVEEWPYSRPPYFVSALLVDLISFWGGSSTGRKLVPIQCEYDRVHSASYNATTSGMRPPVFAEVNSKEEYIEYEPGDIIPLLPGAKPPWSPPLTLNFEGLLAQQEALTSAADGLIMVSTNALGQEESRETSATQSQIISQQQGNQLSEYLANYGEAWPQMAAFSCELLYSNWPIWRPYQDDDDPIIKALTRKDLLKKKRWEVNGRDPASTPAARRAALQQLLGMLQIPPTAVQNPFRFKVDALGLAALRWSGLPGALNIQDEEPPAAPQPSPLPPAPPGVGPASAALPGGPGQGMPPQPLASQPNGAVEPAIAPGDAGAAQADLRAAGGPG